MDSIIFTLLQLTPEYVRLLGQLLAIASFCAYLLYFVKSTFTVTVRISESDALADSLLRHCAKIYQAKHRKSLTALSQAADEEKDDSKVPIAGLRNFTEEQRQTLPKYEPDFNSAWDLGYWVSVQRVPRRPNEKAGSLVLHCLGRSLTPIEHLLKQAMKEDSERHQHDNIVSYPEAEDIIRQYSPEDSWAAPVFRRGRPIDTVCIRQELKDLILDDIQMFTNYGTRQRYFRSGIPYRRGYLFYGSRGTGKTSLYKALALLAGLRLCLVNVAEIELTDYSLQKLFVGIPTRCMIILEEVDPTQLRRNNNIGAEDVKKKGISLSGLLSAIDGPLTPEGHLLIMTTNFRPEDFPKELIRPGRVDLAIEFKKATAEDAVQLFKTAYLQCPEDQLEGYVATFSTRAALLKDYEFSHAELQGFFLTARTPQRASEIFCDWVKQERKKQTGDNEVEEEGVNAEKQV
jgi:chaperone BCS1